MNADVGPALWRVLLQNLAEGDPLPIFLEFFYNNEVGKEAPEARAGSLDRFSGRGAGAATKSLKKL